jgi:hypothetical protein
MDDATVKDKVMQIAKLEDRGDTQEASGIKQELFTSGADYEKIEAMVKKAGAAAKKENAAEDDAAEKKAKAKAAAKKKAAAPAKKSAAKK